MTYSSNETIKNKEACWSDLLTLWEDEDNQVYDLLHQPIADIVCTDAN